MEAAVGRTERPPKTLGLEKLLGRNQSRQDQWVIHGGDVVADRDQRLPSRSFKCPLNHLSALYSHRRQVLHEHLASRANAGRDQRLHHRPRQIDDKSKYGDERHIPSKRKALLRQQG
jgi:hypothetical protein